MFDFYWSILHHKRSTLLSFDLPFVEFAAFQIQGEMKTIIECRDLAVSVAIQSSRSNLQRTEL